MTKSGGQDQTLSHLVKFACELGKIMTRYDFLEGRLIILINV